MLCKVKTISRTPASRSYRVPHLFLIVHHNRTIEKPEADLSGQKAEEELQRNHGVKTASGNAVEEEFMKMDEEKYRHRHKNGGWVYLEAYGTNQIANPGINSIVLNVRDITERKLVEEELKEREEIFRLFLENSPIYIFFKDENIRSLRLSRNYENLIGKTMDELFPSDLAKSMVEDDLEILKNGVKIEIEEEFNGRSYSTIKFIEMGSHTNWQDRVCSGMY